MWATQNDALHFILYFKIILFMYHFSLYITLSQCCSHQQKIKLINTANLNLLPGGLTVYTPQRALDPGSMITKNSSKNPLTGENYKERNFVILFLIIGTSLRCY